MAQWQEVSCENDINYTCSPDLITIESGINDAEHIQEISYRIHNRLKQTRLILTLPTIVPDEPEIDECVKINLSRNQGFGFFVTLFIIFYCKYLVKNNYQLSLKSDFAYQSRLRFNVALELLKLDDNAEQGWTCSEPANTKCQFIVKFKIKLESWLEDHELEVIDCDELTQMPIDSTGEWFAEKWNMWLR